MGHLTVIVSVLVGLREVRARLAPDSVNEFAKTLNVLGVVDLELLHVKSNASATTTTMISSSSEPISVEATQPRRPPVAIR